jgi:hypothetical protein
MLQEALQVLQLLLPGACCCNHHLTVRPGVVVFTVILKGICRRVEGGARSANIHCVFEQVSADMLTQQVSQSKQAMNQ